MTISDLRFAVLGPVRAWRGGVDLDLGSPQQQAILAVLLLRRGTPVTTAQLAGALWGDSPPQTAAGTIRTYISRARRSLGPEVIRSLGPSYVLPVPPEHVDLGLFRKQVAVARRARDPETVVTALAAALRGWRGTPLAGVPGEFAESQRVRLLAERMAANVDRISALLDLGRHAEMVAELSVLVALHPLNERLGELLMRALSGSGRRAEALSTYRIIRQRLRAELSTEPGAGLRRTQEMVLKGGAQS